MGVNCTQTYEDLVSCFWCGVFCCRRSSYYWRRYNFFSRTRGSCGGNWYTHLDLFYYFDEN